jgi:hypothetical protein
MTSPGPSSPFAHFDDATLEELALTWRVRAQRGEREAFGTAHALEVELRRRVREAAEPVQIAPAPPEPAPTRAWWKFWH